LGIRNFKNREMKYLQKIILILVLTFWVLGLKAQDAYIIKDTVITYLSKIVESSDFDNSRVCTYESGDELVNLTPYEVDKYKTNGGRIYVSKQITVFDKTERFFLEKIVDDSVSLYYLKMRNSKVFFMEKDSGEFINLYNNDIKKFRNNLSELTNDCQNVKVALKYVKQNNISLINFMKRYNNCKLKPFPFAKYGINFGINQVQLTTPSKTNIELLKKLSNKTDKNIFIGAFADIPINVSFFSFHPEFNYTRNAFYYNNLQDNIDTDILINFSSFNIPVFLRYTFPFNKFRPFANVGGVFSSNFKFSQTIYESTIHGNNIYINETEHSDILSKYQLGFSAGLGFMYDLNYSNSIFCELRYYQQNSTVSISYANKKEISFVIGFNF